MWTGLIWLWTGLLRPCGYSLASHHVGPASIPGQVMWDLWWTKLQLSRCSPSISVSLTNSHSICTDHSTIDTTRWGLGKSLAL
jgi:hypothetical protein